MKYTICLFSLMFIVSACSTNTSLEELRQVEPTGDVFQSRLSHYYLLLSEEEHNYGRPTDSQYLADKGLRSAYGNRVMPDPIDENAFYQWEKKDLIEGKQRLDMLAANGARGRMPDKFARAQALYDCWLLRLERRTPIDQAHQCRSEFHRHIVLMQYASPNNATAKPARVTTTQRAEMKPSLSAQESKPATLSTSYLIYFEWDRARLGTQALKAFRAIAGEIMSIKEPFELVLNGHTDRSGDGAYNKRLSEARATTIRDLLVRLGVREDIISVFAFGETDPAIDTADGVRERKNRRVEIFVE